MDVLGIGSFASSISSQKSAQAQSEAQVSLIKKQSDQAAAVTSTLIESAGVSVPQPNKGNLIAIA